MGNLGRGTGRKLSQEDIISGGCVAFYQAARQADAIAMTRGVLISETQRRQYEGHNTPLGYYTDQGL